LQSSSYAQLEQTLGELGVEQDAAEYHGGVCGAVSAGAVPLAAAEEGARERERDLLARLRDACFDSLADSESGFTPLLPGEDAALEDRVEALAGWCAGFLAGLGEGGEKLRAGAPEVQEILQDLTEISRADMTPDAEQDEDEAAYTELVEYVRVGAQIIFLELNPKERTSRPVMH
jgi:uncharacterized protein YgfB (UPF0149 family)